MIKEENEIKLQRKLNASIPNMNHYDRLITFLNNLVGEEVYDEDVEAAISIIDDFVDSIKSYLNTLSDVLKVSGVNSKGLCKNSIWFVNNYILSPDRECKEGCDSNGTEVR